MTKLSQDDILKLAQLAQLELTADEVSRFADEISSILGYVEQLQDADLAAYKPTAQVTGLENVTRPDERIEYQAQPETLLKIAPASEAKQIKVKRMIG